MNKLLFLCIPLFVLFFTTSQGQDIGYYHFDEFDLAHHTGVPGVYKMFQDTTGMIWFGSTNGIYRYDGSKMVEFTPDQKKILGKTNYSFLQAKNGDVLIGSDYGICLYSIKYNTVKLLVHINRVFNNRSQYYPVCFDEKDQLWFVVSGIGIGMYNGKINWNQNPQKMRSEFKISDAFYNHKTGDLFLAHYMGEQTAIFNTKSHLFVMDSIHPAVTFAALNSELYRIFPSKIVAVDMISGRENVFVPKANTVLSENMLYSKNVVVDDEWLWVSLRDGILPFNYRKGLFGKVFGYDGDTKSTILRNVSEVFKDKEGNIWICTETSGIKVLNQHHKKRFQYLRDFASSNNITMDIEPVNDSLVLVCPLVETPRLVNIFTNSHRKLFPESTTGISSFNVDRLNKTILLITKQKGELYSFNTSSLLLEKLSTPSASILKTIVAPQAGVFFIYNGNHLTRCKYEKGRLKVEKSLPLGFPFESIIYNPFSNLIFCSSQESCVQIDALNLTIQNTLKPFSGSFIDYAWGKDKTLWLATRSGLQHYNAHYKLIESFNTSNGLNNDVVYAIRFNHDSTVLFLSTNLGISSYNLSTKTIYNFTIADGLQESEHNGAASACDENGNFYFGNITGITVFNKIINKQAGAKPFLIIQNIYIDETKYSDSLNPEFIESIHLYPENNSFGINFSLLSTSNPNKLIYSYKIEGLDNNFQSSNSLNAIRITKPRPGTYDVILRGGIDGGSFVEKRIQLIVHAPFYLKWWVLIPAILLFHVLVYLFIRRIIKSRLRKKQQEIDSQRIIYEQKSQIARELHDNVGARLSMMLNTVDWIGKKPLIEQSDLNEIKDNTKAVIQGLRDAIWVMDKTQITTEELFDKIKYYSNQITRNYPITLKFNEVAHHPIILNTTQALNLFRIVQESLNNALKYASATQIGIALNYKGKSGIILEIQDNGIGFDPDKSLKGHGLKNMQVRADEINASLNLQSTINEGTNITIALYIV